MTTVSGSSRPPPRRKQLTLASAERASMTASTRRSRTAFFMSPSTRPSASAFSSPSASPSASSAPPLSPHVLSKLPHPSPSPLHTTGTPAAWHRRASGRMRRRSAGSLERIVCVRQWTVRLAMPVVRRRRTRGTVGSASWAGSAVGGGRVGEVEEGASDGAAAGAEGEAGRGRRRILASMGRSVAWTRASRICGRARVSVRSKDARGEGTVDAPSRGGRAP